MVTNYWSFGPVDGGKVKFYYWKASESYFHYIQSCDCRRVVANAMASVLQMVQNYSLMGKELMDGFYNNTLIFRWMQNRIEFILVRNYT